MKSSIEFYVGLDIGNEKHEVCELNADGEKTFEAALPNDDNVMEWFRSRYERPGGVLVAMEAGTGSAWIYESLRELGFDPRVGNPRKLRVIWDTDKKNDKRDAEMLARIARFDINMLHPITPKDGKARAGLAVLKARDKVVKSRTEMVNAARGMAKNFGVKLPKCSTDSFHRKVAEHIPEPLRPALNPLLEAIAKQTETIRHFDRMIAKMSKEYPASRILTGIQGVGPVTALAFILTINSPERFRRSRDVGPYLGLVPKQDQSGATDKALGISKAGDIMVRRLLVSCAQYILGPFGEECDLRRYGTRLAGNGRNKVRKKKAVVAVARKLAVVMIHLWKTGEEYDPNHKANSKKLPKTA